MDILKAIFNLIPFDQWLQAWGMGKNWSTSIGGVINLSIAIGIYHLGKGLIQHRRIMRTERELGIAFPKSLIKKSRKNFIESRFQNVTPSKFDELEESSKRIATEPLIDFFLNTAFKGKDDNKFYLVLAGSGMGKTTFMINLYMRYHTWRRFRSKYKMRLYAFRDPQMMDKIKEIEHEEAKNTILLLDAFDEDVNLLPTEETKHLSDDERFRLRLDDVVEAVSKFREVVITSRTQYFPGEENEIIDLKVPKLTGGYHELWKVYLSPFNQAEVKKYLRRKYGWFRRKKMQLAQEIVNSSPRLMVRPMLLSYIEDLVADGKKLLKKKEDGSLKTYEIYETLIEQWLVREDKKHSKPSQKGNFKTALAKYSEEVARVINEQRKENGSLFISKEQAVQVASDAGLSLNSLEITGKSLLTRDVNQNWKFAHKSIFEFYVAKEFIDPKRYCFDEMVGMDVAMQFLEEVELLVKFEMVQVQGGSFNFGNEKAVHIPSFQICKYPVTQGQWRAVMGSDPKELGFKGHDNCPVERVSWDDIQGFLKELNRQTVKAFRLPSESEWEYAARGGEKSKGYEYSGSDELNKVGWYNDNSDDKTHPVGELQPNELGLHDMSGNVWEWCQDHWHDPVAPPADGSACEDASGHDRVIRGGSWDHDALHCRVAYRRSWHPGSRGYDVGFRLAHSS